MTRVRLFVYGSLRRGRENHAELGAARYLGVTSTTAAYALVTLGPYPALTQGDAAVAGELYELDAARLAQLDAFEGDDYRRANVSLADGTLAEAYVLTGARAR